MRFLQAIFNAILKLIMTPLAFLDWLLSKLSGGGAAPADPIPDLARALPDDSRVEEAQDLEIAKVKAAEVVRKLSPELQVKMFATMSEEERASADLTLLTPVQLDWLMDLSDKQLKTVGETSETRIAKALAGEPDTIMAIRSVGQPDPMEQTPLSHRIAAYRAMNAAAIAPTAYHLN